MTLDGDLSPFGKSRLNDTINSRYNYRQIINLASLSFSHLISLRRRLVVSIDQTQPNARSPYAHASHRDQSRARVVSSFDHESISSFSFRRRRLSYV